MSQPTKERTSGPIREATIKQPFLQTTTIPSIPSAKTVAPPSSNRRPSTASSSSSVLIDRKPVVATTMKRGGGSGEYVRLVP